MTRVELMKWCAFCECPSHKDCDLCMYEHGRADERAKVIKEIQKYGEEHCLIPSHVDMFSDILEIVKQLE